MMQKPRILFVDDETDILHAIRRSLHDRGDRWALEFSAEAPAALASFLARPADVVVADLKMPGMNGLEMIGAMHASAPSSKYIILTGTADLATAIAVINASAVFRFFTKPCPASILAEGIEAALASKEAQASGQTSPGLLEAAIDLLPTAIVVVDEAARTISANRRATSLLAERDGCLLDAASICRALSPDITLRLHQLIKLAAAEGLPGAIALPRGERLPLSVAIAPLDTGLHGNSLAALYITDPDDRPLPSLNQLSRLMNLTAAEARLAHALAQGMSLEQAAIVSRITVGTARSYLKQIFEKTGCSRQGELIRMVMSLPSPASESPQLGVPARRAADKDPR
jgi:DNA-binding NarL/FixJ family response regulator